MLAKIPPQAIDIEISLLARIIIDRKIPDEIDFLKPSYFYRSAHAKIFKQLLSMNNAEKKISLETLYEELKSSGIAEEVGGGVYLHQILEHPLAVDPESYAKIIKDKAIKRQIMTIANELFKSAQDETCDTEATLNEAQRKMVNIDLGDNSDNVTPLSEALMGTMDRLDLLQKTKSSITGVPSGYSNIDYITGGFQQSDLIVLAARPAIGKSSIAVNILDNVVRSGVPAAMFSLEMPYFQLVNRMLARHSKLNGNRFKSGGFSSSEWVRINNAAEKIDGKKLFINDNSDMSYSDIRRSARKYKKLYDIKLIVVDYIQLVKGDGGGNREQEVSSVSRNMKGMARELNIPVIVLAQLNRDLEKRGDKRPMLSDLRESGAIEQDADIVTFLYRDVIYDKNTKNPKSAELNFAKHRNGMTGTINLEFTEELTLFSEPLNYTV